jgi:predicted nucleic acid-binding protein
VILVDSSAWIEYLRATGSPANHRLHALIAGEQELATSEPIVMEVLAGARDEVHLLRLRRLLARPRLLPVGGLAEFEEAADAYRRCRRAGETIRSLTDCLIAAVAVRHDVELLHSDRDFEALARHLPLRLAAT